MYEEDVVNLSVCLCHSREKHEKPAMTKQPHHTYNWMSGPRRRHTASFHAG